jgi:hypothetical protein
MSGQVVLYFEDQSDALRFALAAGSVMAGDGSPAMTDLLQKTACVSRIRLNATNTGKSKQPNSPDRAA